MTHNALREQPPDPRAWLERIDAGRRSAGANRFHFAVRNGALTPSAVCSAVWQDTLHRLGWTSSSDSREFLQGILALLCSHPDEALAYAASVIDYEQLPYAERQKIKGRRALNFVMQGKPTTDKQAWRIRSLGFTGAIPKDRSEASALIDRLLQQRQGVAI